MNGILGIKMHIQRCSVTPIATLLIFTMIAGVTAASSNINHEMENTNKNPKPIAAKGIPSSKGESKAGCRLSRATTADSPNIAFGVADFLIAMKSGNIDILKERLFSASGEYYLIKVHPKLGHDRSVKIANRYQLDKLTDEQIRTAIQVVPDVDFELMKSVVEDAYMIDAVGFSTIDKLAAVKYRLPIGVEILSVVVLEKGRWKLCDLPALTTSLLKYKRMQDAYGDKSVYASSLLRKTNVATPQDKEQP